MISQLIISGLAVGAIYALMALAMGIVYKASEVPNFAQGDMAMISAYIAYVILVVQGAPFWVAFLVCVGFAMGLGVLFEFAFFRRAKNPNTLNLIIITLGFQMVLYGLAGWTWGSDQRRISLPVSDSKTYDFFGVGISELNLATILTGIVLMILLWLFLTKTKWGVAMKAVQQNPVAAKINGISTNRIMMFSFGISSVIGAVAGLLVAPIATLDPTMMWDPLLKGFAAAVLGGMTSLPGAILGGFMLGIMENFFGFYISLEFKSVVAFLIIVLVLWFRPAGLLGHHYVKKV